LGGLIALLSPQASARWIALTAALLSVRRGIASVDQVRARLREGSLMLAIMIQLLVLAMEVLKS
jgi:hypothetical protein